MKISNNFPIKYLQKNYQQKHKTTQTCSSSVSDTKTAISNPYLYQAYNKISFAGSSFLDEISSVDYISCLRESRRREDEIVFSYTDSDGNRQKSVIPPKTVTSLLKDENDEVEKKWLDIYVGLYTLKRNELMQEAKQTDSFVKGYAQQIEEQNKRKVVGFKTAEQLKSEQLVLQKAQSPTITQNDFDIKATLFATVALRLLRGEEGSENPRFNEKLVLAKKLSTLNDKFNNTRVTELLVSKSKSEDGVLDLSFCTKLTDLLLNNGIMPKGEEAEFIDYSISILNKILNSTDSDKNQVFECALDLISEGFFINPKHRVFETMFDLCVNPVTNKFDFIAFDTLMTASEVYEQNVIMQVEEEDLYQYYEELEKQRKIYLSEYMAKVTDLSTGEIKPDAISPEDFLTVFYED